MKSLWSTQSEAAVSSSRLQNGKKEKKLGKKTKIPVILMAHADLPGPVHTGCFFIY